MATERQRWKWWGFNEMFALLDIWSDPSIQEELDGTKRNTHVYNRMSELLLKRGIKRSANQVREKMKTLKRAYWTLASKPKTILEGKKMILFERIEGILNRRMRQQFNNRHVLHSPSVQGSHFLGGSARYPREEEEPVEEEVEETEERCESNRMEAEEAEDDKHALHLMLSLGDNPCVLQEEEERNSLSDAQEAVPVQGNVGNEARADNEDSQQVTLESPGSSLEIQCGSPVTLDHDADYPDDSSSAHGKRNRKCLAEQWTEKMLDKFLTAQSEMEKRFLSFEEQRMKEELKLMENQQRQDRELIDKLLELEERRRKEDRDHEMRLFAFLASHLSGDSSSSSSNHHRDNVTTPLPTTPLSSSAFNSSQVKWEFTGTFQPSYETTLDKKQL